jgi:hypothetical protein
MVPQSTNLPPLSIHSLLDLSDPVKNPIIKRRRQGREYRLPEKEAKAFFMAFKWCQVSEKAYTALDSLARGEQWLLYFHDMETHEDHLLTTKTARLILRALEEDWLRSKCS